MQRFRGRDHSRKKSAAQTKIPRRPRPTNTIREAARPAGGKDSNGHSTTGSQEPSSGTARSAGLRLLLLPAGNGRLRARPWQRSRKQPFTQRAVGTETPGRLAAWPLGHRLAAAWPPLGRRLAAAWPLGPWPPGRLAVGRLAAWPLGRVAVLLSLRKALSSKQYVGNTRASRAYASQVKQARVLT